nr:PREDICTED: interleukin-1 receptor-like 1 [Paralichthys olivaceus]
MDATRLLLLIFVVMSTSECSGSETAELQCENFDANPINLLEGEALYYQHYILLTLNFSDQELNWYKNSSKIKYISFDKKERIHQHDGWIFFLKPLTEDSGLYTARHIDQGGICRNYNVKVEVFNASERENPKILWTSIENSDQNIRVRCLSTVTNTCTMFGGIVTWYKDYVLLQGHHEKEQLVENASKQDEGIYTCICTWTHNDRAYNTSASKRLIVEERSSYHPVEILSPTDEEQFADESSEIKLECKVFCGININVNDCDASWHIGDIERDGYNQTIQRTKENPSKKVITTAILTIEKVSEKDFRTKFNCTGKSIYTSNSATLTLKRRESKTQMVMTALCVLFACLFAAVLVKCFAVDLVLLFRPCLRLWSHKKDVRLYDAYVVYQTQSAEKVTESTLCWFLTQVLPSVLEEKCGYRLFIHGRDDMPGEDHVKQVESSVKQSRRLMVILNPGSGLESETSYQHPDSLHNSVIGGFDWQVVFHHALVQRDMSVILIQLGDTGPQGYTQLPIALQHLIRKSAPLRWPEGSRDAASRNSRFWKKVRYLMPATPAKRCQQSALI